jgi:hypothetical protein
MCLGWVWFDLDVLGLACAGLCCAGLCCAGLCCAGLCWVVLCWVFTVLCWVLQIKTTYQPNVAFLLHVQ